MTGLVLREDAAGVAVLSLNRPEVLNALSPKLFEELRAHIDQLAGETQSVGCVVLRGVGRSFSAGNDLNAIRAGERAPSAHFQAETLEAIERAAAAGDRLGARVTATPARSSSCWPAICSWSASPRSSPTPTASGA